MDLKSSDPKLFKVLQESVIFENDVVLARALSEEQCTAQYVSRTPSPTRREVHPDRSPSNPVDDITKEFLGGKVGVRGDGNCFFRSCSVLRYGDQQFWKEVKAFIRTFLENHPEILASEYPKSARDFFAKFDQDGYFGGYIETIAFANLEKRSVVIKNPETHASIIRVDPHLCTGVDFDVCTLLYASNHYNAEVGPDPSVSESLPALKQEATEEATKEESLEATIAQLCARIEELESAKRGL